QSAAALSLSDGGTGVSRRRARGITEPRERALMLLLQASRALMSTKVFLERSLKDLREVDKTRPPPAEPPGFSFGEVQRDVEKKSLVGPNNIALRIVQDVRKEYDNFGLLVDLSHLPLLGQTPEDALVPVKDYLMHVRIGNAVVGDRSHPAYGDAHPWFGIRGGANDVDEVVPFLRVLFDIGYLGNAGPPRTVSFEVKSLPGEAPEIVIANAKRTLNEAWAGLEVASC
ncbi:MAG: hypothetical protein AB1563_12225, partial [Bacillota bacterium]